MKDGVETNTGGEINIQVGMVHHVQSPERRDGMVQDMLQVDRKIQGEHPNHHFQPGGKIQLVEQPPLTLGTKER